MFRRSSHYLYVPLAFAAMLVGEQVAKRRSWWRAGVAVCAVLGAATIARTTHYASDDALWGPEVAAVPECREGQFYLGHAAQKRRAWAEAARCYELAAEPPRDFVAYADRASALQNLGVVRLEQEQFSDAARAFEAALEATGDERTRRELTHNLATAEFRAANPTRAARLLESEVARQDAFPESIALRARALHMLGRDREAAALIDRLSKVRPPPNR